MTFYRFTDNGTLTWCGDGLDLDGPMTSLSRLRLTGERLIYEYLQLEEQRSPECPDRPDVRPRGGPQNGPRLSYLIVKAGARGE